MEKLEFIINQLAMEIAQLKVTNYELQFELQKLIKENEELKGSDE